MSTRVRAVSTGNDGFTIEVTGHGETWLSPLLVALIDRLATIPAGRNLSQEKVDKVANALANTVVDSLARDAPEDDLGPFYSTTGLADRLGVTRQALDGRTTRHTLLALQGDDGSRLYPLFQFVERDGRLEVVPGLSRVMKALADAGADSLTTAAWLTAETAGLDESTAIAHLRNRGDVEPVLELVAADRARWAR